MEASVPTPLDLAPAAAELGAIVAVVVAEAEVDAEVSAVTALLPVVVEEALVPELTAELVVAPLTADVDDPTAATDDVAGPSATSVAVACAVALMPTMDRTHEAAASKHSSK